MRCVQQEVPSAYQFYIMENSRQQLATFIRSVAPNASQKAADIAAYFEERHFSKNEFLLNEGKVCQSYYYLMSGMARAWTTDLEGREVTTAFYAPNTVVCELFSFFKRVPAGEHIQALSDCDTLYISFDTLQDVFHTMPEFREFGRSVLVNSYASLKQRTLSSLHHTADHRYRILMETIPEVFQYASLKQIASFIGVTDTSLSRIRKDLTKDQR